MNLRKLLCNSLIQCHFDYSSSSWYSGISKKLKNKLQVTQNKVIRFIHGYDHRASLKFADFKQIGWLDIDNRVKQLRLNHVHKIFYNKCPSYLHEKFTLSSTVHQYNCRNSENNFYVPLVDTFCSGAFFYQSILDWNSLPIKIKKIENKHVFKKAVKMHLLESMKDIELAEFLFF